MKKYLFSLLCLVFALGISAQNNKKPKVIKLKTGLEVTFTNDQIDSARVVFGPNGQQDSLGIKVYVHDAEPVDYLYSQIKEVVFFEQGGETPDEENKNKNTKADLEKNPEGWRLEFPRFIQNREATYELLYKTSDEYGVNFSLEWDGQKKANRWTCYQLYAGNMVKRTERNKKFYEEDRIKPEHKTTLNDYSKHSNVYDRGHLCPSGDRLCSVDQNKQTFYLSNMQPQIHGHNTGVWKQLEQTVRETYAKAKNCDTLYVVKAATIDDKHIKTRTNAGLIVPKYFYMALLAYSKTTKTYHALGIWSPHESGSKTEYITIKELERRTGIDFFCNLPDATEDKVEADDSKENERYWNVTFSNNKP